MLPFLWFSLPFGSAACCLWFVCFFSFHKKFPLRLTFTYHRPMKFVFEKFIWFFELCSQTESPALKASGFLLVISFYGNIKTQIVV